MRRFLLVSLDARTEGTLRMIECLFPPLFVLIFQKALNSRKYISIKVERSFLGNENRGIGQRSQAHRLPKSSIASKRKVLDRTNATTRVCGKRHAFLSGNTCRSAAIPTKKLALVRASTANFIEIQPCLLEGTMIANVLAMAFAFMCTNSA